MLNITTLTLKTMVPKVHFFEEATKNPVEAQKRVLFEFLKKNKNTEYGKKYDFAGIKSVDDYRSRVPLADCENLRPLLERMAKGEKGILTSENPIMFSLTSGSTGYHKYVPITKYSRSKKKDVIDIWVYYISLDHPGITQGKILSIVSPEVAGYTEAGIPFGAESGHGYKNLPKSVKKLHALPYEVFEIEDYDARYYTMLRISMEQDVTTVATMTPSTIVLLCQRIEKGKDKIIEDIEKGTLQSDLNIPAKIRKTIEKTLKPNPKRAETLRRILSEKGELLPKYFWPNLELIECWKGGTVGIYLKELPRYFGDVAVRDFGYFSSEARCSIPMTDEGSGGVLAVNANFYEFILKEDMNKTEKKTFLSHEIEKGKEYFIILTTPGGLYRYNIDDLIKVSGFFNKTPLIEFVQKGLNVTSVTGEKLYEAQVVEAVKQASDRHSLRIEFFMASIEFNGMPRYVFLVEFNEKLSPTRKKDFLVSLDKELKKESEEYEFNRVSQELDPPALKVVSAGEFERYKIKKIKEGMHDSQFKLPQLTANLSLQKEFKIDEVIEME